MSSESTIFGISTRAFLAVFTVLPSLIFLYVTAVAAIFFLGGDFALQLGLLIVTAVIGFINLALGFYLGQKITNVPEGNVNVENTENLTVQTPPAVTPPVTTPPGN